MAVHDARPAIEAGQTERLGAIMSENHALLAELGVSWPAPRRAGRGPAPPALGAELSGGGRGGNMVALVTERPPPRWPTRYGQRARST